MIFSNPGRGGRWDQLVGNSNHTEHCSKGQETCGVHARAQLRASKDPDPVFMDFQADLQSFPFLALESAMVLVYGDRHRRWGIRRREPEE